MLQFYDGRNDMQRHDGPFKLVRYDLNHAKMLPYRLSFASFPTKINTKSINTKPEQLPSATTRLNRERERNRGCITWLRATINVLQI